MRQQTFGKRLNYLNHLAQIGSFSFDDMISSAEKHGISRVIPYHLRKLGLINTISNNKYVMSSVTPQKILNELYTIESQKNKDAKIKRAKKAQKKKIENTYSGVIQIAKSTSPKLSEFNDDELIIELRNRGYSGEINKSFKI